MRRLKITTLQRQSGFSLLSVMVAAALIGILVLTVMQLAKMISTQSRLATNLEDVNNIAKQVSSILSVPDNCVNIYGSTPIDLTNIGNAATTQLEVSNKAPFNGAPTMNSLTSGRIRLLSMKLIVRQTLAGATQPWYLGDAIIQADDPNDIGSFAPRRVPINFRLDGSNQIIACAAAGQSILTIRTTASESTGLAYGDCGPGQVMIGIGATGVKCTGGAQTTSGQGCTGDNCIATDGGPCYGMNCMTTGNLCQGMNCTACNNCSTCKVGTSSCTGSNCCHGPNCAGC